MSSIRCAVCDDNTLVADSLKEVIANAFWREGYKAQLSVYTSGVKLLQAIRSGILALDVLFLDLEMPDLSGLDIGKLLKSQYPTLIIIVISNRSDYAFEAYKIQPFRFIRKSHIKQEIPEAIHSLIQSLEVHSEPILLSRYGDEYKLNPEKIIYIESHDKHLHIHYGNELVTIRYKLSGIEEQLRGMGFIRIHKGILVNSRYIFSIKGSEAILDNNARLPISRQRLVTVKRAFHDIIVK